MIYSKSQQLKSNRRKPKRGQLTKISKADYEKAIEEWGAQCTICGNPYIEMHHVRFRSSFGSGNYPNLHPLCKQHHDLAHKDKEFRFYLEVKHQKRYGHLYWADPYKLHELGVIEEPTRKELERYFEKVKP